MRALLICLLLALAPLAAAAEDLAALLAAHRDRIAAPSRQSIGPVIEALAGAEGGPALLAAWADKRLALDGERFLILGPEGPRDALTGDAVAGADKAPAALKPNSGVRGPCPRPPARRR